MFRALVGRNDYSPPERVSLQFIARTGTYYPQPLEDGSLMFTAAEHCAGCSDDLYAAGVTNSGTFAPPVRLEGDFNSKRDDWDLIEHPLGHLRLWASAREGGAGRVDIYFSRLQDGRWSSAKNLSAVSSPAIETAPRLSPDGEVLFFQRIENGREQIYWVGLQSTL